MNDIEENCYLQKSLAVSLGAGIALYSTPLDFEYLREIILTIVSIISIRFAFYILKRGSTTP